MSKSVFPLALAATVAAIAAVTYYTEPTNPFAAWVWYMGLILAFIVIAGLGITGQFFGLLIDSRNKMSLSRFQLVLWTVVILAALMAIAMARVLGGKNGPLDIHVPEQIWVILGISTTSLIGSPLLLSQKSANSKKSTLLSYAGVPSQGLVAVNATRDEASWADLFRGEEVGNRDYLDMAKIQMFFFTLVLVTAYAVAIAHLLYDNKDIQSLPDFDSSMTALLAISHAGYLTNKAAPHTPGT